MKRKLVRIILLSVILATLLSGCLDFWHPLQEGEKEEKSVVSSVTIIPDSATVLKGKALQFGAEVIGSNSPAQTVTWAVLGGGYDTAISENGLLTVADDETATCLTVKATSTVDNSKSSNATVTITTTTVSVTDISLNKTSLSLSVGGFETLIANVSPSDATNKSVLWSSGAPSIATVSLGGLVTGVSAGSATITATTSDGGKTATCAVSVTSGGGANVAVTGVSLNKSSTSLTVGNSETLTTTIAPSNATNKNVTWSSNNSSVASVSSSGNVSGMSIGSTTITVTTADGNRTATCSVSVTSGGGGNVAVTGVSLNKSSTSLTIAGSETLTATVAPANATNKNVTWSSSNTAVATVSGGTVTAVAAGTAAIIVSTEDGGKTATCTVTVNSATIAVTGVTLNKTSTTITAGNSETLTATVAPANATNKNVTWSSSNTAVATVSGGIVSAVAAGTAAIIVSTEDGGKTATCTVTVNAATIAVTGVTLNKSSASLTVGATETLTATVAPSNATNKTVSWSSSATSVATVSNGTVTAVAAGSATITVSTADGNRTATCAVTVISGSSGYGSFVRIEGGTFTMGSPSSEPEHYSNEGPQHQVTVSAFYMGKYEVTQAEYQSVMGTNPSYFKWSNLPVEQVSWYDAAEFCNRLSQSEGLTPAYTINGTNVTCNWNANGYRLPTEAEWEYACRAGTTTPYSTGNNITTSQANFNSGSTKSVGSFAPNPWGLYDMHGNVWEWCWDWYGNYSSGAQNNPRGPVSGDNRVIRGGGWGIYGQYLRSAIRLDLSLSPSDGADSVGFRLVRP